jgi:ubiquinone/menaquinone biosynthesis C-methylase UbiE
MGIGEHLFGTRTRFGHGRLHGHIHGNADEAPGAMGRPGMYHALTAAAFLGRRAAVYDRLAALAELHPGEHAVDLGCGTGALTLALARRVGPTGSVLGVDASEQMVAYARRSAPPQVRYAVTPAEALDLPEGSVDAVATALAMHHIAPEQRLVALGKARQALRPGGRLVLVDFRPPTGALARRLVGAFTGPAMQTGGPQELADLARAADLQVTWTGRVGPLLCYAVATRA